MAHDHSHHHHNHQAGAEHVLSGSFVIILIYAVVEAVGGWWSGSLALLGDAGHMFFDASALALAWFAAWFARRPAGARHSYGWARAEAVAALVNGLLMLLVVIAIVVEAVERLQRPQPVQGGVVMLLAFIGLAVNLVVLFKLSHGGHDLNTRGALLHVMGDTVGSIGALVSGAVIYFTGWMPVDPLLSLVICGLILFSTLHLLRDVLHVFMEGVPGHLSLAEVGQAMAACPGVREVHDLHLWALGSDKSVLSAHVVVEDMQAWPTVLDALRELLAHEFYVDHVTLQPELPAEVKLPWPVSQARPRAE